MMFESLQFRETQCKKEDILMFLWCFQCNFGWIQVKYARYMNSHILFCIRVKSSKFGHQVNSDIHLQTVEIQMRRLLMSRLIGILTVCLVNLLLHSSN